MEKNKPVKLGIKTGRSLDCIKVKQLSGEVLVDLNLGRKDFKEYFAGLVAKRIIKDWDNLVEYSESVESDQIIQKAVITILGEKEN